MAQSHPRLSRVSCWCSTIKERTPTCSASIDAMAARSGRRTARCFSTGGRLLCIGDTMFLAAPDIILDPEAVKSNPTRAAQIYENNSSRVLALRPGTKGDVSQTNIVWSEHKGVPGVPSPLYYKGRLYTFQNGGIVFCRMAKTGQLVY